MADSTPKTKHVLQIPDKFTRVWNSRRPYQIWYGGRGSAKSWTKAIYFLTKAMQPEYCRTVFARDTQKNVRLSQYQLFKDLVNRFECFQGRFEFLDTSMKITCTATGNFLIGGSFEMPDSLRSVADPTDFWAEEPITRTNEISRQDFFDIVGSLRNADNIQTQFHFTFNPISRNAWIYKDFFEQQLYDCEKLFVNYWDNPFCPQSTIDFLRSLQRLDVKRYRVDGLGEWGVSYEGLIYSEFETVDEWPENIEPDFYGVDFGYNDPTAIVAGKVIDDAGQDRKTLLVNEVLYETGLTADTLKARMAELNLSKRVPMICDNARPEMIEALYLAGYNARGCNKYKGSVQDGISAVKRHRLKITRQSRNLLDEIATYCWKADKGDNLLDEPVDAVNHACDGMRYGLESVSKGVGIYFG